MKITGFFRENQYPDNLNDGINRLYGLYLDRIVLDGELTDQKQIEALIDYLTAVGQCFGVPETSTTYESHSFI